MWRATTTAGLPRAIRDLSFELQLWRRHVAACGPRGVCAAADGSCTPAPAPIAGTAELSSAEAD